ncbi:YkvA family protein [Streptomyces longispororuber]|uniref:YkvA family protein n=1 Tax=Streptomyces longispororuber TaxID=68230 RepID=UPI0036F634F5
MSDQNWPVALIVVVALVLVVAAGVALVLFLRLLRARRLLRDAGIPVENKLAFWGALIYVISPVDLLPDPVYLDDIGVLLLALRSLHTAALRAGRSGRTASKEASPPGRG